jgi:glycosyltransferase involved in cell wall biosynthesis
MDWFPNEDAIRYFLTDIYPRLLTGGSLAVSIVGRNPSTALRHLAARHPAVEITGAVEDVRPFIGRSAVYAVPLRIGGGTRIKILEAMAMGKPVVTTAVGAEGLPVTNGTDVVIADEPDAFANHIRRLLSDVQARRRLGAAARHLVTTRLTWAAAADEFSRICEQVVAQHSSSVF